MAVEIITKQDLE